MDFSEDTVICRFCLEKFTENCAPIGDGIQHTLNFLTLYPNLTISDNPMMCETCVTILTKCFDFKTRCLSTEDCIASFTEGEGKKIDLRDIYSRIKLDGNIDRVPDDHSVCRFCLELVKDDAFMSVRDDVGLIEILQKFFLELDLKITNAIIACTPCYNSLRLNVSFVNNYMNIEQKIDEYCQAEGLNYNGQVDLRNVATFITKSLLNVEDMSSSLIIKEEKLEHKVDDNVDVKVKFEDSMDVEQGERFVNKEVQHENSNSYLSPSQFDGVPQTITAKSAKYHLNKHILKHKHKNTDIVTQGTMHKCDLCDYEGKRKCDLKRHILIHKTPSEITMHKCELCDYEAKRKCDLKSHMLIHKTHSEITMYKCPLCDHETKWKGCLRKHMVNHKTPSEITMYKCKMCDYETRHKVHLSKHMVVHMDESKIEMHKCEVCDYETRHKEYLPKHMLIHMDESKIEMHECEVCSFKTKYKKQLRKHLFSYKATPGTTYTCDLCDYEAKRKCGLMKHMRSHEPPSEITMYKCDLCDYETKQKTNLKRHILSHKTPTEITMYKCAKCDYKSKYKDYLRKHMSAHVAGSGIKMYKCKVCPFTSKWNKSFHDHLRTHAYTSDVVTEGTTYKCDLCNYEAKQESDLKVHILTHKIHSDTAMFKRELLDQVDEVQPEDAHTKL